MNYFTIMQESTPLLIIIAALWVAWKVIRHERKIY